MKSGKGKTKKLDRNRFCDIGTTFSRTTRAQEIVEKAKSLCTDLQSKRRIDDSVPAEDLIDIPMSSRQNQIIRMREEVASNLKIESKKQNNKSSRVYDSVFGSDQESAWAREFRKTHKRRLSAEIKHINPEALPEFHHREGSIDDCKISNQLLPSPISIPHPYELVRRRSSFGMVPYPEPIKSSKSDYSNVTDLPPLDSLTESKYFGSNAKQLFYQTYHEINRQTNLLVHGTDDIIKCLNFDDLPYKYDANQLKELESPTELDPKKFALRALSVGMECDFQSDISSITDSASNINLKPILHKSHTANTISSDYYTHYSTSSQQASTSTSNTREGRRRIKDQNYDLKTLRSNQLSTLSINEDIATCSLVSTSTSYLPASPRAKFLAGCVKLGIAPRSAILLRPDLSHVLNLEHQSMGDQMGMLLANGLNAMPNIQVLNLADNNLTDLSLKPLLDAVSNNPNIVEIDLSENKLDSEASESLGSYLAHPQCKIRCLRMKHADVDDSECHDMIENLMNNHSLEELDLSRNLLGKDENLNAIKPETITAGESLAELLRHGDCHIKTLKVPWNMIRMEGAQELCGSLSHCHYLTHLDMAFNALSSDGGLQLGCALHDNQGLKELIISNNGIGPAACVAICVGIRECPSLKYVCMDGNLIGEQGTRSLVSIPLQRTDNIIISTKGCNLEMKEDKCWFDYHDGYHRAVFFEILRVIAWEPVYNFSVCEYSDDGKVWHKKKIVRYLEKVTDLGESERELLFYLKRTRDISKCKTKIEKIFNQFCSMSGELTKKTFFELVQELRLRCAP
eukprot:gene4471-8905_t